MGSDEAGTHEAFPIAALELPQVRMMEADGTPPGQKGAARPATHP
jgi:hypothetical protein